jgi:Txe/YoeB family toxin of Txe-Axe toxin-antitoxin module
MYNSYEEFKKYEVAADSIEDFLKRYTKPDRLEGRCQDYMKVRIESYTKEFQKDGFTFMSHHESITGRIVSYYGRKSL